MFHENRALVFNNHLEPVRAVFLQRDSHEQITQVIQRSVAARNFQARCRAAFLDDVDDTQVRKITDADLGDIIERVLVVQSRGKYGADICQKPLFILNTLQIGDIAKGNCHHAFATNIELRNGGIGREFLTVFAQSKDWCLSSTHAASRRPTCCKSSYVLPVDRSKALRNENVERSPHHFGFGITEDTLCALVEDRYLLILIDRNDCIGRNGHNPRKLGFGQTKRLLHTFALGDVAEHDCDLTKLGSAESERVDIVEAAESRTLKPPRLAGTSNLPMDLKPVLL